MELQTLVEICSGDGEKPIHRYFWPEGTTYRSMGIYHGREIHAVTIPGRENPIFTLEGCYGTFNSEWSAHSHADWQRTLPPRAIIINSTREAYLGFGVVAQVNRADKIIVVENSISQQMWHVPFENVPELSRLRTAGHVVRVRHRLGLLYAE
jgi:hypothetical protein